MRLLSLAFLALPLTGCNPGQFVGPGAQDPVTNVKSILSTPVDEQRVTLRGRIIEKVGAETYIFTDDTARIRVEIDRGTFPHQNVTPETQVTIRGEVEIDARESPEIDVHRMKVE